MPGPHVVRLSSSRHPALPAPRMGLTLIACLIMVACRNEATSPSPRPFVVASISTGSPNCALAPGGAAYCWGDNSGGELGTGSADTLPHRRPEAVIGGLIFQALAGGVDNNCGITIGGAAYCWGWGPNGELGNGTADTIPHAVPVPVSGALTFQDLTDGGDHTCGITTSGATYCWGGNSVGDLGTGDSVPHTTPVLVGGGLTFRMISAGDGQTCGVTAGGAAYCWGSNDVGQLGSGDTLPHATPVPVAGGQTYQSVSAGGLHACGVTTSGAVYCWGWNLTGQLGNGTTVNSSRPVPVSSAMTFRSVAVGGMTTCAVTTAGAALCWGANGYGDLGIGVADGNPHAVPSSVSGGLTFESLSIADFGPVCGATKDGAAFCWGRNWQGELGNGGMSDRSVPTPVVTPDSAT